MTDSGKTIFKLKQRLAALEEKFTLEQSARMRAEVSAQTPDERVKERDAQIASLKSELLLAEQSRRTAQKTQVADQAQVAALSEQVKELKLRLAAAEKDAETFKDALQRVTQPATVPSK